MSADHETCAMHPHVTLVSFCPACRASQGGKAKSEAKARAARENGKKRRKGAGKGTKRAAKVRV